VARPLAGQGAAGRGRAAARKDRRDLSPARVRPPGTARNRGARRMRRACEYHQGRDPRPYRAERHPGRQAVPVAWPAVGGPAVTSGFNASEPNMARVYDYWLGGKDHFAADREEAERLLRTYPPLRAMVRENRAFVTQAVTWAARQGIGQFIDLGAGLPVSPAVHQTARTVLPSARVAYVDNDPVVLAHARALLATGDGVAAVTADLRDPAAVLADPELRAVIDLAEPVGVILGAVMHFLDADAARAVTAKYAHRMAPGSCLAISCARYDDEALGKRLSAEYTAAAWHNHPYADIVSFFAWLELVGPGVTEAQTWRAWMPEPVLRRREGHVLAGVARKPYPMSGAPTVGSQ
jgi:O-methyltransferase involved in polyketide biosynthesis